MGCADILSAVRESCAHVTKTGKDAGEPQAGCLRSFGPASGILTRCSPIGIT